MLPATLIRKKRDGQTLTDDELGEFVGGFVDGSVADYQMSAMAMAMCIRGLDVAETASLTRHMLHSGQQLPRVTDRPRVDKHSTGGLGDKVSLILAPLLACLDVEVPMVSGRGLGRTGGTLDKLEAIPGFQTKLSPSTRDSLLRDVGTFIISADETIAPADAKLYALRDVTGTVESIGLITGSILSKKLAASLDALIMDVKVGSAAFMTTQSDAIELAESLVRVGGQAGLPTQAMLSDMDQPLGQAIGNAIEVNEAVDVLSGGGPTETRDLTVTLAANALTQVQRFKTTDEARDALLARLRDGTARERFEAMVRGQGGIYRGHLRLAPAHKIVVDQDGHVSGIDCHALGDAVIMLGGGRRQAGDKLDPSVGLSVHVRIGDRVTRGQPWLTVHATQQGFNRVSSMLQSSLQMDPQPVPARPLILGRLPEEFQTGGEPLQDQ